MSIKLIAIGNRVMCDEGIAVKIAEKLKDDLYTEDIEVIFGETDKDISFEQVKDTELFLVLDATCYNIEPGTITVVPIERYNPYFNNYITNHDFNVFNTLYNKSKSIQGYMIGIEIDKITFDNNLSKSLDSKFVNLSEKVKNLIKVLKFYPNIMDINIIQNQINCLN